MKLQFDKFGYLHPYETIHADLDLLKTSFAFNEHRRWLFNKLLLLLNQINELEIKEHIELFWIDGSFVTQKELPQDIDVVAFIYYQGLTKKLNSLKGLQLQFKGKIDFYFEPYYPQGHRLHPVFLILKNDWEDLYSHTRRQPTTQKVHQKGFLQINLKQ